MDALKKLAERLFEKRADEDIVDRVNNSVTPFVLLSCAIIVFAKEYGPVSEPMYCWSQAEFNSQWMEYVHDFCFVESTYYVPFNNTVPVLGQRNKGDDRLSYYQWVPFILVAMALFSQFTHYFWSFCNMLSEKELPNILRKVCGTDDGQEQSITAGIGRHFNVILSSNANDSKPEDKKRRKSYLIRTTFARNYLAVLYLFTKLLYLLVNIVQFKFISVFLGVNKLPNWGFAVLNSFMTHGSSWEHNGLFPRVTLCDLKIRQPDEHFLDFTVQCVLVANFLNEKIFLMLYFLFILMAIVSFISLLHWTWTLLFCTQKKFVNKLFELSLLQLYPDPEFDVDLMIRDGENDDEPDESGVERAETEDGEESEQQQQHGRVTAVVSNATTKTNLSDAQSGTSSNSSTARAEEMARHSNDLLSASAGGSRAEDNEEEKTRAIEAVAVVDERECLKQRQQQQHSPSESNTSASSLEKAWDDALMEAQKRREELYRNFKANKNKFLPFLGIDGIMIFKMMYSSAGLQMTSLVMGQLFIAFNEYIAQKVTTLTKHHHNH
uniref:Innexin n=1 Tax=Globodera rostochiensis TaxID=31243 RepID=A0A914ICL7_GLORO